MVSATDLLTLPLFEGCDPAHVDFFARHSADLHVVAGEWIVREDEGARFYVLISGTAAIVKTIGARPVELGEYELGDGFGEIPLLMGSGMLAGVRAVTDVRVARVDGTVFWRMMHDDERFAETVSNNMGRRVALVRHLAIERPSTVCNVLGDSRSPSCYQLRDFLSRMHVPFDWDERDGPECDVIFSEGTSLHSPAIRELAERLGLSAVPEHSCYDIAIVGAGPAGLAAAVYAASEGLDALLVDRYAPGGQAGTSSRIENYLGFPAGISGEDLADRALRQAQRFGADIVVVREVCRLEGDAGERHLVLEDGQTIYARAVVLAPGIEYRSLTAEGCSDFVNRGLYYGASQTEAAGVAGKNVHIVGGGNSAGQAALNFAGYAENVTIVIRGTDLGKSMSSYLVDRIRTSANIRVLTSSEITAAHGDQRLERITIANNDGTSETVDTAGLFVFIGAVPRTDWLEGVVARDKMGYLLTGPDVLQSGAPWPLERHPYFLETSQPGVFAAGDARLDSLKRVASSVGEGSSTISMVHEFLASVAENDPARRITKEHVGT
ncbi:MAG TPA: FAD-dependent oxidoreductase [Candidatus Tumulicola sp.]|jgi:thioredoxin reductase (NADPH)